MEPTIFILDDDPLQAKFLADFFESEGYQTSFLTTPQTAVNRILQEKPKIVFLDIQMEPINGHEILQLLNENNFKGAIIILSAYGDIPMAVSAIKNGAYDFLEKPIKQERAISLIEKYLAVITQRESLFLTLPTIEINGVKESMAEIFPRISLANVPILITGESGTGKEVVAQALHNSSARKGKPMVSINCAAIPRELMESEFFGHESGAFTGATSRHLGFFEQATGSSIFFDEIGEMNLDLQAKLLRVLETRKITRIGGNRVIDLDFRIIAATNRNLTESIKNREFREDLFYRLNVIHLHIPPLRDRKDQILEIARHLVHELNFNREFQFSKNAVEKLMNYPYPGNVRELRNILERALILSNRSIITEKELLFSTPVAGGSTPTGDPENQPYKNARDSFEREYLVESLNANNGNVTKTARQLGIGRRTLQEKMKKLAIKG